MEIVSVKSIAIAIYIISIILVVLVIFKDVKYGILYFLPLIPLRFIFERIKEWPLGSNMVDIVILAIIFGWFFSKTGFSRTKIVNFLFLYVFVMFLSLLMGYLYLGTGFSELNDSRLQFWKDYILMPIIFLIVLNNIEKIDDIKKLVFIISIVSLVIVLQFYTDFSDTAHEHFDERNRIVTVLVFLGPNHLAAFFVEYMAIFLSIHYFLKRGDRSRIYYLFVAIVSFYPILFLYSRGAYIAAVIVLLLLGMIKDRRILVACFCCFVLWQIILPKSVVERVNEESIIPDDQITTSESVGRLKMWGMAFDTFKSYPIFGIGFRAFENLELEDAPVAYTAKGHQHRLRNVHSIYFQTLAEMGIIGITMLLYLFLLAFKSGWQLYKTASDNYLKGLGLGFSLCVIASMITNLFGDRWYILLIQIYFWMFWALVERGLIISKAERSLKEYAIR